MVSPTLQIREYDVMVDAINVKYQPYDLKYSVMLHFGFKVGGTRA